MIKKKAADLDDPVQEAVLNAFEVALDAQLRAIRRLRNPDSEKRRQERKSMSQVDMVFDILRTAGVPMHITAILERVEKKFGQKLDRESVVSSLVKKVRRLDRFVRTDKNVFGLRQGA